MSHCFVTEIPIVREASNRCSILWELLREIRTLSDGERDNVAAIIWEAANSLFILFWSLAVFIYFRPFSTTTTWGNISSLQYIMSWLSAKIPHLVATRF